MMGRFGSAVIPKEHGAWAVLLVPVTVSVFIAEHVTTDLLLLMASAMSFFLAYYPLQTMLRGRSGDQRSRFWAGVYIVAGIVFGVPLLVRGFLLLIPIAALAAGCFFVSVSLVRGKPKSVGADLWAVIGLTMTGPSAGYVLNNSLSMDTVFVWILHVLFFGSGVIYVHMKLRAAALRKVHIDLRQRMGLGALNLVYHVFVIVVVSVFVATHYTPALTLVAFVPMSVHALMGTVKLSPTVRFRNLGFLLLAQSLVYGFLLGIAYGEG
ncbi:MAG: hypothetical protein HBSIN02_13830 [Bacteroidia bacterium]|nr:MAG: hypothetical protein HBSIN02_13830 [Bacteroidia bacterium]